MDKIQKKKKGFGLYARQPRKNLHTRISVNKPKLPVTKHDQTLILAHMYDTSRYTANTVSGCITAVIVVPCCLFVCRTDHIFAAQRWKTTQKTAFFPFLFCKIMIVLNQFLPLALSWLTLDHFLNKVNKPCQKSASTSKKLRSNQALVKKMLRQPWKVPCSRMLKVVLSSVRLAQNSAVGPRGNGSTR